MEKKIAPYNIKINRGDGFKFEGSKYLNVFDTNKQKGKVLEEIRKEYKVQPGEYINISNFNDVYH